MADDYMTEMPWGVIVKRTVQATGAALVVFTALAAAAVHQGRSDKAESERFRWSDKNRWE
ncbi:MAG TPA: hypothetical protein VF364_13060 [Candidatus Limnocylindria bacterium]